MKNQAIEKLYQEIENKCQDHPKWIQIFKNCFSNTLEKALIPTEDGVFVLTGDIPAMWLRDSTAQVRPYIFLAKESDEIMEVLLGVIKRQIGYILHDPYANAFNQDGNAYGEGQLDHTQMTPFIWERKYEVDSLCYPMQLGYLLYKNTGETKQFNMDYYSAMESIYQVWKLEQRHENSKYTFERDTDRLWDTLLEGGKGPKQGYTGMTWSGFRPSDDHCEYSYLVPSNMFAVVVLGYMAEIAKEIYKDEAFELRLLELKGAIHQGVETFGKVTFEGEEVYAYEVDGLGNFKIMDDANIPSLLSMPYLGYPGDKKVYEQTLKRLFSPVNPYYYEGSAGKGIGSSHTWENYIWHLSMAMEGLASDDRKKKAEVLDRMVATDGGTGFMHESFDVEDPTKFTREWFSWPNMLFCELLLSYLGYELKK